MICITCKFIVLLQHFFTLIIYIKKSYYDRILLSIDMRVNAHFG